MSLGLGLRAGSVRPGVTWVKTHDSEHNCNDLKTLKPQRESLPVFSHLCLIFYAAPRAAGKNPSQGIEDQRDGRSSLWPTSG